MFVHNLSRKKNIFCAMCKKVKNISLKHILDHRNLFFFTHTTKTSFFSRNFTCEHRILDNTPEFTLIYFYNLKYDICVMAISKPMSQNRFPLKPLLFLEPHDV